MNFATAEPHAHVPDTRVTPVCAVFGECGGCRYQDRPYAQELKIKENEIRELLIGRLNLPPDIFEPITASPLPYGYRSGLDLSFIRTKDRKALLGFMKERSKRHIITIDACPIAQAEISAMLPELRDAAFIKLPANKRMANLVVKISGDGRVRWGGAGKGTLVLQEADYLWADICGNRIYFSLDTFFQANTAILPLVKKTMERWIAWDPNKTVFYDLYAGVGLFGFLMADRAKRVVMIEKVGPSMACARYTRSRGNYEHVDIREGKTEAQFPLLLEEGIPSEAIALVDPPRRGLSPEALESIASIPKLGALFYLSCGPESLFHDVREFIKRGWSVKKIAPFDFFPKTKHIETLVLLEKNS